MMKSYDEENFEKLTQLLKPRFGSLRWRKWEKLANELCQRISPGIPTISKMNKLLAEVFDMNGLGGDFTFENILHSYICLKLRLVKKCDKSGVELLRTMFDKPYMVLDHFKRARFKYDAREFVEVQGIIHPSKKALLDDKTQRVVVTGDYTLLVPCDPKEVKKSGATLLFVHHMESRVVIPKEIAGYKINRLGDFLFYSQRTLHELYIPKMISEENFGALMCAHCSDLMCVWHGRKCINDTELEKKCFSGCDNFCNKNKSDNELLDFKVGENEYEKEKKAATRTSTGEPRAYTLIDEKDKRLLKLNPSCLEIAHQGFFLEENEGRRSSPSEKKLVYVTSKGCSHLSKMGTYAFRNNVDVEKVDLSGTVITRIEFATFSRCKNLKEIVFPKTLQYISPTAFHMCCKLEKILFGEERENRNFTIDQNTGMLFTSGMRTLLFVLKSSQDAKELTIDIQTKLINSPVVHIGAFAFSIQQLDAVKFEVPEGVTFIGENAFRGNKLQTLCLPKTLMAVGPCAFSDVIDLKFEIDKNHCFFKTSEDGTILYSKDGTKLISGVAYSKGTLSLKGVKEICGGAFLTSNTNGEENLLILKDIEDLEYIAEYAFEGRRIQIDSRDAKKLKAIGKWAFKGCTFENSTIKLSKGINWIGREAFKGCTFVNSNLELVKKINWIGREAFKGINWIGREAFSGRIFEKNNN